VLGLCCLYCEGQLCMLDHSTRWQYLLHCSFFVSALLQCVGLGCACAAIACVTCLRALAICGRCFGFRFHASGMFGGNGVAAAQGPITAPTNSGSPVSSLTAVCPNPRVCTLHLERIASAWWRRDTISLEVSHHCCCTRVRCTLLDKPTQL
jgi:hypothetical protein